MKQLKWVIILSITAVVLLVAFLVVNHFTKEKETRQTGEAQTLFSVDPESVNRITIDGEEGNFAFDWNAEESKWMLTSEEQFTLNEYAVATICNYFCDLSSLKTVAFDCEDTATYGFDDPVTVKVYTQDTGGDNPYILYVGDSTPTFNAYYAMVDGSDDVYTIDYTRGSVFCVAKNTLKNMYLFDTLSSEVSSYRLEKPGEPVLAFERGDDTLWKMTEPKPYAVLSSEVSDMMDVVVRATVESYGEEHPKDLAQYGLDEPKARLLIEGTDGSQPMRREILFGDDVSDTEMYGYFVDTEEVFIMLKAEASFMDLTIRSFMDPYCADVDIADISKVEVDMGDIYDLDCVLSVDYENEQYALDDLDIDALDNEEILTLFQTFYRSVSTLQFTDLDMDGKPEGDAAATITYTYHDGHQTVLEFVPKGDNEYYLLEDGVYRDVTLRLNRFTADEGIIRSYEALLAGIEKSGK